MGGVVGSTIETVELIAPPPRALSRPPGAVPCLSLLFVTDSQIGLDSLARARFLRCNGQRGSMSAIQCNREDHSAPRTGFHLQPTMVKEGQHQPFDAIERSAQLQGLGSTYTLQWSKRVGVSHSMQ